MDKIVSYKDVIDQLSDGMTIGVGGWGARRKPMSVIREICQSDIKDLTIVSYGGPDVGLLCAHKKVKKLIFGFVSLDMIPLESHFRQARQKNEIEVMELDEVTYSNSELWVKTSVPKPTRVGKKGKFIAAARNPHCTIPSSSSMTSISLFWDLSDGLDSGLPADWRDTKFSLNLAIATSGF